MALENRQPSLYAATLIPYLLAIGIVGLRFTARRWKNLNLWLDDWLVLASTIPATALVIDLLIWTKHGYGNHAWLYNAQDLYYHFELGLFIGEITYTLVLMMVKFSVLALYWRIFNHSSIRWPIYLTVAIVTCWGVAVIITSCVSCIPTRGLWDKSAKASCRVNNHEFLFGLSIPNILTDLWLLSLPLAYISQLNMSRRQKFATSGMFLLGGVVTIASIMRLVSVITQSANDPDTSYDFASVGIWTMIESNLAIISACLPCLRPIWTSFKTHILESLSRSHTPDKHREAPMGHHTSSGLFNKQERRRDRSGWRMMRHETCKSDGSDKRATESSHKLCTTTDASTKSQAEAIEMR